jgi:hypothetical protein
MSTFTPRRTTVPIFQGDDYEKLALLRQSAETVKAAYEKALRAEDEAAKRGAARSLDEAPESVALSERYDALAAEHDALLAEATERSTPVVIQALGRKKWRSLVAEHPAREANEEDEAVGVNEDTFAEALLMYVNPDDGEERTILSPEFADAKSRMRFLDALSDAQFQQVYINAFALNRALGEVPKALSSHSPRTDETTS